MTQVTESTLNAAPFIPDPSVYPRKPTRDYLPVMVVGRERVLLETGELHPRASLAALIVTEPPSVIVAYNIGKIVAELEERLGDNPKWQFRASPIEREVYAPNRSLKLTQTDTVFAFIGFQGEERVSRRTGRLYRLPGHYHYPVDPTIFARATANELRPDNPDELSAMLQWGTDLRDWTLAQGLKIKPTAGGIAGQLLRDPRFYPKPRRKVPAFTNRTGREQLPGNYYRLFEAKIGKSYRATYLDQISSHHSIARSMDLPHADHLCARGFYRDLGGHRVLARAGTEAFQELTTSHRGLIFCNLTAPPYPKNSFELPFMGREHGGKNGYRRCYVYTNEIPYIRELGGIIDSIIAAWTSPQKDEGIPAYAEWAQTELANSSPERKRWLKGTLLATYGILASKPRHVEFGFRRAKGGVEKIYHAGGEQLTVLAKRTDRPLETPTVNAIQRGMIEAETRLRSLKLARTLHRDYGVTVLAVYADSVFVDSRDPLPFLPAGWQIQGYLTNQTWWNSTSFTSRELDRLPGIAKHDAARIARIKSAPLSVRRRAKMRRDKHPTSPKGAHNG